MDTQMIIMLCIIYSILLILIILNIFVIVRHFKNKKRIQTNEVINEGNKINLIDEIKKVKTIIKNNEFIDNSKYLSSGNKIFSSGKILVNSYGLFVINEFNDQGTQIEGDFNSREWFLHSNKDKVCINNLLWNLNKNIEMLIPILPLNLPIVGILVFKSVSKFDINNYPSHLVFTNVENLCSLLYDIKKELKPIISDENVVKIKELLRSKIVK
ncbi:hypothetical protein [Metamycoplasma gateae]|uniref:NERD domain-containing protein n=1 Tax=Metamycoplasma gateae TaxID=35769 RepID=A0ABZ2AJQ1_9BACT|nr:hypothetical protein V2E26_01730 [Metamycoplasma gateae]